MFKLKGIGRNIHLRLVSEMHFHSQDENYDFRNPVWHLLYRDPPKDYTEKTHEVYSLMADHGALIQEIYGLNLLDLLHMDVKHLNQFKQELYKVVEERAKRQKEVERKAAKTEQRIKEKGYE